MWPCMRTQSLPSIKQTDQLQSLKLKLLQDLVRCDGICIICREEMIAGGRNKKLHCSHVFHMHCLRCASLSLSLTLHAPSFLLLSAAT